MLRLRFSTQSGRVELSCAEGYAQHLQGLRNRFGSSVTQSQLAFDLELDDLLVNLRDLARWPDTNFDWQPELLQLVEDNASDANTMEERLREAEAETASVDPAALGGGWVAPLTEFQIRDISKLLGLTHGANFSVPGAGKTRVALAVFQARKDLGEIDRMLVVCPKAAFESWVTETQLCFADPPPRVSVMDGPHPPFADIVLINYERLPDARAALLSWLAERPALLVLDEAHRMKRGPTGAWGKTCLAVGPYATRRLILTGTPAPNGASDLENLFAFVWPGLGRSHVARALNGRDLRSASQLLRPLFVRTTKPELQLPSAGLPPKVRRIVLPPLHRELYDALLGQLSGSFRGGENEVEALGRVLLYLIMAATTPALLATGASPHEPLPYRVPPLRPPAGTTLEELMRDLPHYELSPKYQEVLTIVAENAECGRKTLVWSTFVRNLKSLEVLLAPFNPAIVHGGSDDRMDQLTRFRHDASCTVLLSNPATLGEGVSLHQVCNDAVYVDRDFAAGRFLQSLDRIHRLGLAEDTVTRITILVAESTIDELVEQRLAAKIRFLGGVLDDPAVLQLGDLNEEPSVSAGMDLEDLQALMSYLRVGASS